MDGGVTRLLHMNRAELRWLYWTHAPPWWRRWRVNVWRRRRV